MATTRRGIDHLVLTVRDLERCEAFFRAVGFALTPRAHHPFGTSNNLAIFQNNFLELLAVSAPDRIPARTQDRFSLGAHSVSFLERREGLSFIVLDSDDARADHSDFLAAGMQNFAPVDFSRAAGQPDGTEATVAFSIAFAIDPRMKDAPHFVCQQHAPENFWHKQYQNHPNGALAITEVTVVAGRPEDMADVYRILIGGDAVRADGKGFMVTTPKGRIAVLHTDDLARRYGGVATPVSTHVPYIAGLQIAVADLADAERHLQQAGADYAKADDALRIGADQGFGAVLEFTTV